MSNDPDQSPLIRYTMIVIGAFSILAGAGVTIQGNLAGLAMILFGGLLLWAGFISQGRVSANAKKANSKIGKPGRRSFGGWPEGVPKLYPFAVGHELCEFMTQEEFEAIKQAPIVTILPMISKDSEPDDVMFGAGLQLLLIRDLMLVRNLSVHGPEDTPKVFLKTARELAEVDDRSIYVAGAARHDANGFLLELEIHKPGVGWSKAKVSESNFHAFLLQCATTIAESVGGDITDDVRSQWQIARPGTPAALVAVGWAHLSDDDTSAEEIAAELVALMERDPEFALPAAQYDSDLPNSLEYLLEGLRRDPYDAQACFSMFIRLWNSTGWQPEAMQFARRAIEISPGHGKANMCAPHAAHPQADMLKHSELGYRLLPGNPFAVNNYVIYLSESGAPTEQLTALAKEGISADPNDPTNYERLIELFTEIGQNGAALEVARQLQTLYEPEMNERALYCLRQNPTRAKLLELGKFDPAAENRKRIEDLEAATR